MSKSLFDFLKQYKKAKPVRCHTPGHSGKARALSPFKRILGYDITEIDGADSLYASNSIIKACETKAAEIFECEASLISAGGCTLAIQTMLALCVKANQKIAIGRNAHRCAVSTLALLGACPIWIYPQGDMPVSYQDVASVLEQDPEVCAVYLTSPDYCGRLCDIAEIAVLCKTKGIPLLVDNAHGSHLGFLPQELDPIKLGATMAAYSLHKTLPVFTGGALLNIAEKKYVPDAKHTMAVFGSTSPSYLIMASIDLCLDWLKKQGRSAFSAAQARVDRLKDLARSRGFLCHAELSDKMRLTLDFSDFTQSGCVVAQYFLLRKIVPDFYDSRYVVFILTPQLSRRDFKKIEKALKGIKLTAAASKKEFCPLPVCRTAVSPRTALLAQHETVSLETASGKICAEVLCPCPPGIPVVVPGEEINDAAISCLKQNNYSEIKVLKQLKDEPNV